MKKIHLSSTELHLDTQLYELLLNEVGAYIFVKDTVGQYLYVNKLVAELFGTDLKNIQSKDDSFFFEKDDVYMIQKHDQEVLKHGKVIKTEEKKAILGKKPKIYQTVKKPIYNKEGDIVGMLGISTDITEIYTLKEHLHEMAYQDYLTNISNRTSFHKDMNELLALYKRYETPFTILLMDIDDFKKINDTYGHDIGDHVLIELVEFIQKNIRLTDKIYRVGGEEFVILFPNTQLKAAVKVAEKLRRSIAKQQLSDQNIKITVSIGVAEVSPQDSDDSLYKRVDKLLYYSKASGKNRISY